METFLYIILPILTAVVCLWAFLTDQTILYSEPVRKRGLHDGSKGVVCVYCLPETVFSVEARVKIALHFVNTRLAHVSILKHSFVTTTAMQADTSQYYALRYSSNHLSNDEVKLALNEHGLLESLNVIADNQATKVVSAIVNAPSEAVKDQVGMKMVESGKETKIEIKEYIKSFSLSAWQTLKSKYEPWEILVDTGDKNDPKLIDVGFYVKAIPDGVTEPKDDAAIEVPETVNSDNAVKGLLFRTRMPVTLKFKVDKTGKESDNNGISIVNKAFLYSVPIRSSAFAKRKQDIVIKNGELLSHSLEKPSAVMGFISIPINLAKALVAIPAQLISFRIDTTNRRKDLEAASNTLAAEILKGREATLAAEQKILQLKTSLGQAQIDSAIAELNYERQLEGLKKSE